MSKAQLYITNNVLYGEQKTAETLSILAEGILEITTRWIVLHLTAGLALQSQSRAQFLGKGPYPISDQGYLAQ